MKTILGRVLRGLWARRLAQPDSEKTPIDSAQVFKNRLLFILFPLLLPGFVFGLGDPF
jgi:hypothetical protein